MGWARVDDTFADHRKVGGLPLEAVGLWTLTLTWAHRNTVGTERQGRIPAYIVTRFAGSKAKRLAALLVGAGLWETISEDWVVHDFDQYLPTAKTREARSKAGSKGAARRWQRDSKLPSASEANGKANDGSRERAPVGTPVGTTGLRPSVPPEPVPTTSGDESPTAQTLLADHISACRRRPPNNVVGQLGKQIAALLAEGIEVDHIRGGLAQFRRKDVSPSLLPSLVNGVMNPPTPIRRNGQVEYDDADEAAWR